MHPTVLIVAVLLLHGVSGHLFQRALPHKLIKQLPEYHARQSDADADDCVDKRLEEALRDETLPSICVTGLLQAAINNGDDDDDDDNDDDDDDLNQEEFNAAFSWFCRPECGNFYLSVADDCGEFEEDDDVLSRDFFIGLCGTNENGDKCYESFVDTVNNTILSEFDCYFDYFDDKQCNCRSLLLAEVREKGCCLDPYHDAFEARLEDKFKLSELYDACDVNYPSGCNNSPIGSGFMPQVALVTLISALIFSVVFS